MGVLPQMVGVLPTYGARRPFLCKIYKVILFLWYYVFHNENICMSRIRDVFGYELVSKSFIHWLSRYDHEFLGWASCPTLPYQLMSRRRKRPHRKYEIRKLYCLLHRHVVHQGYMQQSYYRQHTTIQYIELNKRRLVCKARKRLGNNLRFYDTWEDVVLTLSFWLCVQVATTT